jgi:hypothetical protein
MVDYYILSPSEMSGASGAHMLIFLQKRETAILLSLLLQNYGSGQGGRRDGVVGGFLLMIVLQNRELSERYGEVWRRVVKRQDIFCIYGTLREH